MQVAAFTELTGPSGVEILEREQPDPGPGEAVVDVEACALNRHDLWILDGESTMVSGDALPFVTGLDVAGVVHEVGDGVSHVEPGDRVLLCPNETCGVCRFCREGPENQCERFSLYHGGLAEYATTEADRLLHLEDDTSMTSAAAIPTAYMTAYRMLQRADVEASDLVFVPGATGGVGVATVQLCDVLGARSIGTSSSADKLDRVRDLGLDHGINARDTDEIRDAVLDVGRPDVVVDHLGGEFVDLGQSVLRRAGTHVICGRTAGPTGEIDLTPFFLHHRRFVGSTMGTQGDLHRLLDLFEAGDLDPVVHETYPLAETADAFEAMAERDTVGKLVVTP